MVSFIRKRNYSLGYMLYIWILGPLGQDRGARLGSPYKNDHNGFEYIFGPPYLSLSSNHQGIQRSKFVYKDQIRKPTKFKLLPLAYKVFDQELCRAEHKVNSSARGR